MKRKFILSLLVFIISCRNPSDNSVNQSRIKMNISDLKTKSDSLYKSNNYELAIEYFTALLKKDSVNADIFFKRAYSYAQIFKYQESTADYLKAIELNYRKNDAYFNLGCNFSAQGNFDQALYYFQMALEQEPNNQVVKDQIKTCLGNMKRKEI